MKLTAERIAEIGKEIAASVINDNGRRSAAATDYETMVKAITAAHRPVGPAPEKGAMAGMFIRAIAAGKGDPERGARWAKKAYGEDHALVKTLQASDAAAGGVLVPTEWSSEVIELLREMAIVRSMGPRIMPMPTGSLQIPKLTGGATSTYIGETDNIVASEQTFGQINLTWKKLACIVPISNDMLRFEAVGAENIVRDDTLYSMAQREDQAFLLGDGTENTPIGLDNFVPTANSFAANATINLANVTSDLADAVLRLRNAHCRFINVGWLMAPRSELYLRSLRDANGNFAFKEEMDRGTLFGWKYGATTEIPINLGGSSDESTVYLVDFADCIIGESNRIEVDSSSEASYWDGSALQSAYSRDLTLLKVVAHHDFGVRHEDSLARITAVKWTP